MSNDIKGLNNLVHRIGAAGSRNDGQSAAQAAPRGEAARGNDSVSFTSKASQLQALESNLKAEGGVDVHRVRATQIQLAKGNYVVDHQQTANKFFDMEVAMERALG